MQSLPKHLTLDEKRQKISLLPISELSKLRESQPYTLNNVTVSGQIKLPASGKQTEIRASFYSPNCSSNLSCNFSFGLKVRQSQNSTFSTDAFFTLSNSTSSVWVDRSASASDGDRSKVGGELAFDPKTDNQLELIVYIDHSVIEVFAINGTSVITTRVYPPEDFVDLSLFSSSQSVLLSTLSVWSLRSAWDSKVNQNK